MDDAQLDQLQDAAAAAAEVDAPAAAGPGEAAAALRLAYHACLEVCRFVNAQQKRLSRDRLGRIQQQPGLTSGLAAAPAVYEPDDLLGGEFVAAAFEEGGRLLYKLAKVQRLLTRRLAGTKDELVEPVRLSLADPNGTLTVQFMQAKRNSAGGPGAATMARRPCRVLPRPPCSDKRCTCPASLPPAPFSTGRMCSTCTHLACSLACRLGACGCAGCVLVGSVGIRGTPSGRHMSYVAWPGCPTRHRLCHRRPIMQVRARSGSRAPTAERCTRFLCLRALSL